MSPILSTQSKEEVSSVVDDYGKKKRKEKKTQMLIAFFGEWEEFYHP